MANKNLFSTRTPAVKPADARNEAGGLAYTRDAEEALASFAVTGCLGGTFYASAESQLDTVLDLAKQCSDQTVADVAIYARRLAFMKDMPALLLAVLASRKTESARVQLQRSFGVVIDNGRMLRNFVQIVRSGKVGRKSFGTAPKRLVREFFERRSPVALVRDSIGNQPSIADCIKLVHPKASTKEKDALFGYLTASKKLDDKKRKFLPMLVKELERFKTGDGPMPEQAPFQMLTAFAKSPEDWLRIFQRASWTELRMNINTFKRHGVFDSPEVVDIAAKRIRDPDAIRKSKVFPYQLLVAYKYAGEAPHAIREALQDALEVATENVPDYSQGGLKNVVVAVDVSGSMSAPVTGSRGATTVVTCKEVAALVAASILRTNRSARVIPFSDSLPKCVLNPRDSLATNQDVLARLPSGGTDCSLPLELLNRENAKVDLVIFCSDNQSWMNSQGRGGGTKFAEEWNRIKARNPAAKLVTIDMAPIQTTLVGTQKDVLRIGGFSDVVFDVIGAFQTTGASALDVIRTAGSEFDTDLTATESGVE